VQTLLIGSTQWPRGVGGGHSATHAAPPLHGCSALHGTSLH
jgi:hypothetical protein